MDTTPNLLMPLIMGSQAQKHVTHNEALRRLDAIVQLSVITRGLIAPPPTPANGARYLVPPSASGAWTGHTHHIAAFEDGAWTFYAPGIGWLAFVADETRLLAWTGAEWRDVVEDPTGAPFFGINATADAVNRLAVRSQASLFDHAGAGHQIKLNKSAAGDTASLLFQTGHSGRAEIGTTGDDRLHVKVSVDGSAWKEALVVNPASGQIGIGTTAPEAQLHLARGPGDTGFIITRQDDTASGPNWNMRKSRGTPAAPTVVQPQDVVSGFVGQAFDGSGWITCAAQRWIVDGPVAANSVPTRIEFHTFQAGSGQAERMRVTSSGSVGIGTSTPTARLDVAGTLRVGQFAKAALPSASASGAGAIAYVSDEAGGAVLAFSDGSSWRRVTDRMVVT